MPVGWMLGRPNSHQAGTNASVATMAAITVARRKVVIGSPLTFTRMFHVPWKAAATSAIPTAIAIKPLLCRPARPGDQTSQEPEHLGVDHQPVVRSPDLERRNVGTQTRAEVDDIVGLRVDRGRRHDRSQLQVVGEATL